MSLFFFVLDQIHLHEHLGVYKLIFSPFYLYLFQSTIHVCMKTVTFAAFVCKFA